MCGFLSYEVPLGEIAREGADDVEKKSRKGIGGRPSKYKPEYADLAYKFCLLGATDAQLAEFLGVDVATIYRWKDTYSEFCDALKRGKEIADAEVAASLYKRAKGYQYEEITVEPGKDGTETITKRVVKEVAPDTGAAMAWLKNRQPQNWRDKHEIEHSGGVKQTITHDLRSLSPEELVQLEQLLSRAEKNEEKTS